MCAIGGLLEYKPIDAAEFKKSLDLVRYRGPDGEGFVFFGNVINSADFSPAMIRGSNKKVNLAFGHRRLAILDLSNAGSQPMSAFERYWVVHNGEIYNYKELRIELEGRGHKFRSNTDTEVILHAYKEWGEECVSRFNGMWAFAVFDEQESTLFLSRDRFGVKPLYFARTSERFGFASEIKQLRQLGFGTGRAHSELSARYLYSANVDDTRSTLFDGIERLMPGESLTWKLGHPSSEPRIYSHYSPQLGKFQGTYSDWSAKFGDILKNSVQLRLRSDVPAGSCLSGGLDSSTLVALVGEVAPGFKQKTFTSRFKDPKFDEFRFAELVIDQVKAESHVVYPDLEILWREDISKLTFHQDEPFQSTSIYAQWKVMELARSQGVKVLLDGQGADELLGGYHRYLPVFLGQFIRSGRWGALASAFQKMRRSGLIGGELRPERILASAMAHGVGLNNVRSRRMGNFFREGMVGSEMLNLPPALGLREYLRHDLLNGLQCRLRYEDRNSMAHSIEARTPFLDYRLVDHVLSGREEWFFEEGMTKAPMRTAFMGRLPESVRMRSDKMGFVTPEFKWYQDHHESLTKELLDQNSPLWVWMDRGKVAQSLTEKGLSGLGFAPWRWLSFKRWLVENRLNAQ